MASVLSFPIDAVRGLGRLPHVGSHPGTPFVLLMAAVMATAAAQRGDLVGAGFGLAGWVIAILPVFLIGAASRARLSDRMERRRIVRELLEAWVAILPEPRALSACFARNPSTRDVVSWIARTSRGTEPELPAWICDEINHVFTHAPCGRRAHEPRSDELKSMTLRPEPPSAHSRMTALAVLREVKQRQARRAR